MRSEKWGHRPLFNHFVRAGKQRWRHRESEHIRGLEIDDEFELRWLLDREFGWLGALEDLPGVDSDLTPDRSDIGSIADQAPCADEFLQLICRRNGVTCRQRYDPFALSEKEGIGVDDESVGVLLGNRGESGVKITVVAGLHDKELNPLRSRRLLRKPDRYLGNACGVGVYEEGDRPCFWNQLGQQLEPLR